MEQKSIKIALTLLSMIIFCVILLLNHVNPGAQNNYFFTGAGFYLALITTIILYGIGLILMKYKEVIATIYLDILIAIISVVIVYLLVTNFSPMSLGLINEIISIFALVINLVWFYFAYQYHKELNEVDDMIEKI